MYYSNSDIRIEEMPVPEIGPREILMRVEASGICGTDVMEWYRADRVPLVLGHEVSGVIVKTGKGVRSYKEGDRIVCAHHVPCGVCRYCRRGHPTICDTMRKTNFYPGGFAEYIRVPSINVERGIFLLPKNVSYEEGTFIEPLACVIRAQRIAGVRKDDCVVVVGSGISGMLHIHLAKVSGAAKIVSTDIVDYRLKMARTFGADEVINAKEDIPKRLLEINKGMLADVVIICTGSPDGIRQAIRAVARGGTVLFFAATDKDATIPFSINDTFWRTEVTLASSYAGSPEEHKQALGMIKSGKVKVSSMITHRFPLREALKGFQLVASAKDSLKVIIQPRE